MSDDQNVVYIGRKPVMSYVLAVITYFNTPNAEDVVLKARGRAITTAVDVSEVTRRRFMEKIKTTKIEIGTEEVTEESGKARAVSTIDITLSMKATQAEATQAEATQAEATQAEATQAEATQAEATQAEATQAEATQE